MAPSDGTIAAMNTGRLVGQPCVWEAAVFVKTDQIDHAVGFVFPAKIGDTFTAGDTLGTIHANDEGKLAQARQDILAALTWSDEPVEPLPHFHGTIQ